MIFFGENGGGTFLLPNALSVEINSEFGVPADDMTVKFARGVPLDMRRIYAVRDGYPSLEAAKRDGGVIFIGTVDETVSSLGASGESVTVYSRSPAALPLDNECEPGQYIDPTLDVMFIKHLARFGIVRGGDDARAKTGGTLTAARGQSHWSVVSKFCAIFLSCVPRISFTGEFRPDTYLDGGEIVFDNAGGIPFSNARIRVKRCGRVSRVYAETGGGRVVVDNADAHSDGIIRERRIYLDNSRTGTLSDADSVIKKGEEKALTASVSCVGFLGDVVGRRARVALPELSDRELFIYRTKYTRDARGGRTQAVLSVREERQ